jgi:rhodanese-related sulfurtransferase
MIMTTATQQNLEVPKPNQTVLGLYVTPTEAYEKVQADPEGVKILDVRTFEEYVFVGHPTMAKNIPLAFPKFSEPADGQPAERAPGTPPAGFNMEPNPEFLADVKNAFKPSDTILILCGSGGRAAMAVNMLAKAGFTNVYNIVNGFSGEMVVEPTNPDFGKSLPNGWMSVGLPWGRSLNPDLMWENA